MLTFLDSFGLQLLDLLSWRLLIVAAVVAVAAFVSAVEGVQVSPIECLPNSDES